MNQSDVAQILNFLSCHYYGRNIRHLDIQVNNKSIILLGQTDRFFIKQIAQELVKDQIPKEFMLENKIQVVCYTN